MCCNFINYFVVIKYKADIAMQISNVSFVYFNCDITFQRNPQTLDFIGFGGFSVTNLLLVQSNKFIVSFNSSSVLWV